MSKPDANMIASLEALLQDARAGVLVGLFVVTRDDDGDYASCYHSHDLGDLLLQVRTEVIRTQCEMNRPKRRRN